MEHYSTNLEEDIQPPPRIVDNLENYLSKETLNSLQFRMMEIETRLKNVRQIFNGIEVGNSSFRDVSLNRLSVCKSDLRHLFAIQNNSVEDEGDSEEIFKNISTNFNFLEQYLGLLESYPNYLQAELSSNGGMFPDISDEADRMTKNGSSLNRINYYITQSAARLKVSHQVN